MPAYIRFYIPGGTYFFTVVTNRRAPLLANDFARRLLGSVLRRSLLRYPTHVVAIVLLPDHLHVLCTLPDDDDRYSLRWSWIKSEFARAWSAAGRREPIASQSARRERRRGIWQRRFWEHTIRDEADFEAHFDYIHYNPVKHGLTSRVGDWPWSSFHRWAAAGHYPINWGGDIVCPDVIGNAGE